MQEKTFMSREQKLTQSTTKSSTPAHKGYIEHNKPCKTCKGTGYVKTKDLFNAEINEKCKSCRGKKKIMEKEYL